MHSADWNARRETECITLKKVNWAPREKEGESRMARIDGGGGGEQKERDSIRRK